MDYDCERTNISSECVVWLADADCRAGVGEAVMHAPGGASVVIDAGVFVENIVVSKQLSIFRFSSRQIF